MKKGSLDKIMHDMIKRLAVASSDDQQQISSDILDDIGAFAAADPVLASLHKEYLEELAQYKKLVRENGFGDPMAEVAADMLASARSAVQTRLIELQNARQEETREALKRRLRAKRAAEELSFTRLLLKKKREKQQADDLFLWFVMLQWFIDVMFSSARHRLSAANDFALVSVQSEKRSAYA